MGLILDIIIANPQKYNYVFVISALSVVPAQLLSLGIVQNTSCTLNLGHKGCSRPREVWFNDIIINNTKKVRKSAPFFRVHSHL